MIPELKIVTFGSALESTPEGLYRMDQVRMREEAQSGIPFHNEMIRREEEYFLFGDIAS